MRSMQTSCLKGRRLPTTALQCRQGRSARVMHRPRTWQLPLELLRMQPAPEVGGYSQPRACVHRNAEHRIQARIPVRQVQPISHGHICPRAGGHPCCCCQPPACHLSMPGTCLSTQVANKHQTARKLWLPGGSLSIGSWGKASESQRLDSTGESGNC